MPVAFIVLQADALFCAIPAFFSISDTIIKTNKHVMR